MLERELPLFGLSFFADGVAAAAEAAIQKRALVFTPNAEMLCRALRTPAFFGQLERATLLLPDGVGVTLAAALQGKQLPRAAGVEFGEEVAAHLAAHGGSLFLYGGREGVAARAAERLSARHRGLVIAGSCHGYGGAAAESALLDRLRTEPPAVLFVCLGSPRQETVAAEFKTHLPHTAIAALGGSLDLYAGDLRRAPRIFRACGCEWLWRVLCEPRRIRRMWALPLFLLYAVRAAAVFWWKVYRTRGKAKESSVKNHKI